MSTSESLAASPHPGATIPKSGGSTRSKGVSESVTERMLSSRDGATPQISSRTGGASAVPLSDVFQPLSSLTNAEPRTR